MNYPSPPNSLKERVEQALAWEYRKDSVLRAVSPQPWKPTPRRAPAFRLIIQATPNGEEEVPGLGIYRVDVNVTSTGRATKYDPAQYIAAVSAIHASYGTLYVNGDTAGYDLIFFPHALKVYGAWPREVPATIANDSVIDNAGLTMMVAKLGLTA